MVVTSVFRWFLVPGWTAGQARIDLKDGWWIQSSAKIPEKGEVLSTKAFHTDNWYRTSVPATVLTALIQNKLYPDPYFGMNLRQIPRTSYNVGQNFANIAMPADSPFAVSWWYRTEFALPAGFAGKGFG